MSIANFAKADVADMFAYLDELRASGKTNMFGAGSYLASEYALEHSEAGKVLSAWMTTFDGRSVDERAASAVGEPVQ